MCVAGCVYLCGCEWVGVNGSVIRDMYERGVPCVYCTYVRVGACVCCVCVYVSVGLELGCMHVGAVSVSGTGIWAGHARVRGCVCKGGKILQTNAIGRLRTSLTPMGKKLCGSDPP